MARAKVSPLNMRRLDFIVLAPQVSIEKGTFAEEVSPSSIRAKVERRVSEYEGQLDQWYEEYFEPTIDRIQLYSVSWEEAIGWIGREKPAEAAEMSEFYGLCLKFS